MELNQVSTWFLQRRSCRAVDADVDYDGTRLSYAWGNVLDLPPHVTMQSRYFDFENLPHI